MKTVSVNVTRLDKGIFRVSARVNGKTVRTKIVKDVRPWDIQEEIASMWDYLICIPETSKYLK